MKKYVVTLFACVALFVGQSTWAQTLRIPVAESKTAKIVFIGFTENISITGYQGNELIIQRDSPSEKKGETVTLDNNNKASGIGLKISQQKGSFEIAFDESMATRANYIFKIPNGMALKVASRCQITISEMTNEIEIVESKNVQLANCTGSVVVSGNNSNIQLLNCIPKRGKTISVATISGNILVNFSGIETLDPIQVNSISGDVIIELPSQLSVNFKVKSLSGTIRSDFKFPDESRTINQMLGDQIHYQTSDNAPTINVNTVSGNILLRNR